MTRTQQLTRNPPIHCSLINALEREARISQLGQIQFPAIEVTSHFPIQFAMLSRLFRTALADQIWSEMNEEWAEYVHGDGNSPAL